jgi:hypothetical protein
LQWLRRGLLKNPKCGVSRPWLTPVTAMLSGRVA